MRQWHAKRRSKDYRSRIISHIWRCMDFCIFWATIMNRTTEAETMEQLERDILARLDVPDPYATREEADRF